MYVWEHMWGMHMLMCACLCMWRLKFDVENHPQMLSLYAPKDDGLLLFFLKWHNWKKKLQNNKYNMN